MKVKRKIIPYILSRGLLIFLVLATFYPIVMMINMSLKTTVMIKLDFLGLPLEPNWDNYDKALKFVIRPIINSILICTISVIFILINSSLSGFAYARLNFKGRDNLFFIVKGFMMVPASILIIPQYMVARHFGLINSYWGLILFYIAMHTDFGTVLARTAFLKMPRELFEAAKIDGAGDFGTYFYIALPLVKPTLITIGIQTVRAMYNDYLWPTIVMTGSDKIKTFCQIAYNSAAGLGRQDIGLLTASFVIGTIPLIFLMSFCMKYFISGISAGSVKG